MLSSSYMETPLMPGIVTADNVNFYMALHSNGLSYFLQ